MGQLQNHCRLFSNLHKLRGSFAKTAISRWPKLIIALCSLGTGASVALSGKWQQAPQGTEQLYELKVEEVTILGRSSEVITDASGPMMSRLGR